MRADAWEFEAVAEPDHALLRELGASNPVNPMATAEFAQAMHLLNKTPWYLSVRQGAVQHGCLAFREGRRYRPVRFEVPSLPALPAAAEPVFWAGVLASARRCGAWDLYLDSFGSEEAVIPDSLTAARRLRTEFVVDLDPEHGIARPSTGHRRNAAKAQRAGLLVSRTRDPAAVPEHVGLMGASMDRRVARGEQVAEASERQVTEITAYLNAGLAELFQARDQSGPMSSICILRAESGAYYHSAGTTPEGMTLGASHFLILELARILAAEGLRRLNLGGAGEESPGLQRFKEGFGSRPVPLEAAVVTLASPLQQATRRLVRWMRNRGD